MRKRSPRQGALEDAIRAVGTMSALARELGTTVQSIAKWDQVPAERALEVERITGVSRYRLRPDIYGPDPKPRPNRQASACAA